jgi:hypothetical protein
VDPPRLAFARSDGVSHGDRTRPGDCILHPLILGLLVLWAVNDHLLKDWWANALTGKLSDVAGLAVFPLLPLSVYEIVCGLRGRSPGHARAVLVASLAAVGAVMVGINTSPAWADTYRVGLGALQWPFYCAYSGLSGAELPGLVPVVLTRDPTDLWTLPALFIPWWVGARSPR